MGTLKIKEEISKNLFAEAGLFSRQNFVLSTYPASKFGDFSFEWFRNWSVVVGFCSTTAS